MSQTTFPLLPGLRPPHLQAHRPYHRECPKDSPGIQGQSPQALHPLGLPVRVRRMIPSTTRLEGHLHLREMPVRLAGTPEQSLWAIPV
ncbi:MAG: hypothetical protein V3S37_03130 [Dehalococcoidia bacterium]